MALLPKIILAALVAVSLLGMSSSVYSGIAQLDEFSLARRLQNHSLQLDVEPARQLETNSCGEAAIMMAYNYAHPAFPLTEETIIYHAQAMGYYTPDSFPFTSPENMVKLARQYTEKVITGNVLTSDQGLALLDRRLQEGNPVIIDIVTRLGDPEAGAHFVVVTGISTDDLRDDAIQIHYNDPLTGSREIAPWGGEDGLWLAWKNNGDPGGSGWWMVIPTP